MRLDDRALGWSSAAVTSRRAARSFLAEEWTGGRSAGLLRAVAPALFLTLAACGLPTDAGEGPLLLHPNGDALAVGDAVVLSENVAGDAMAAGGSVEFDGLTGGSFLGAGGDVRVRGRVEGSVRAAGGNVVLLAEVYRNVTLAGGNVEVGGAAEVLRNAYLAGGSVRVEGSVDGDLYAGGREVVLDGAIGGDARVEAERLTVAPGARIAGELRYRVAEGGFSIAPDAVVGEIRELPPREDPRPPGALFFALRLLAFVVCGTALVALFPGATDSLSRAMAERPAAALGWGVLWIVLVPIVAAGTAFTLVGLPLALIAMGIYAMSLYAAPIVVALWVGAEVLPGATRHDRADRVKKFLVGGPIVAFAILLPWVGWIARFLATLLGVGALLKALFEASIGRRGRPGVPDSA